MALDYVSEMRWITSFETHTLQLAQASRHTTRHPSARHLRRTLRICHSVGTNIFREVRVMAISHAAVDVLHELLRDFFLILVIMTAFWRDFIHVSHSFATRLNHTSAAARRQAVEIKGDGPCS